MPRTTAQSSMPRSSMPIDGSKEVGSSPAKVDYRQASGNKNTADVISAAMSPKFVNEVYNDKDTPWRWVSTDRIQELLKLGKPDQNGFLYYRIVHEGEEKGIHCVSREQRQALPDKEGLRLHKPSIDAAIKGGRPLAFLVGHYGGNRVRLVVLGYSYDGYVARVAQFDGAREAGAPQKLLRIGNGEKLQITLRDGQKMTMNAKEAEVITGI